MNIEGKEQVFFSIWKHKVFGKRKMDTHLPAQIGNINKDEIYDIDERDIL